MNVSSLIVRRFAVLVNKGNEICHLWRNKCFDFLTICQFLHVLEEKSGRVDNLSRGNNFFLESENPAMKIFKLFSILEGRGGYIRLNITIHPSKVRGTQIEKSVDYIPS